MAFNKESFEHFWQHLDVLFGRKVDKVAGKGLSSNDYTTDEKNKLNNLDTIINAPKDFIIFKDRSTDILYYGGVDNGNWVTWCDVDYIEAIPVTPSKIYIEGMRVSPEDLIVTAVFVDGTSKIIDTYQFDNSKLTPETTAINVIYSDNNGVEHTVSVPVTVTEMNSEDKMMLIDFEYDVNGDGTYTLTDWKETYNGEESTEIILPDSNKVIL